MGIYFRDILLIRISRGTNNCVQHVFEKNIYFIMRFSHIFKCFSSMKGSFFVIFFKYNIKRINNAGLFSEPSLIIFTKGANNSDHDCIYTHTSTVRLTETCHSTCILLLFCWFCLLLLSSFVSHFG